MKKKLRRRNYGPVTWQQLSRFFLYMGDDPVNDKEFKQMLTDLVAREEKYLQVNSEEFNQRHRELMELIERAGRKE